MENLKVRAHHGMCLVFFIGKGYSDTFVENMNSQKEYLEHVNPIVEIVCQADHICKKCPHNNEGVCTSIEKVYHYDYNVLDSCGIQEGTTMYWSEYTNLVNDRVIKTGIRKKICKDCEWNSICESLESSRLI